MSKVIVVTGGGSGIGKSITEMLPREYTVLITGRNLDKLNKLADTLNAQGYHIETATCDVSKREDVAALAAKAAGLGEIERVIHCAGISGGMGNAESVFRINALGTVHVNQEFYKVMEGGIICDIASDSGYMLPAFLLPSKKVYLSVLEDEEYFIQKCVKKCKISKDEKLQASIAYLASKNFARWYSQSCAYKYMLNKKIRVFSISPGFVKTPMTDLEQGEATDCMLSYSGLKRGAEAEELAYLAVSLSDPRCGYLLGTDVLCDGGCVNNGYGLTTATKRYSGGSENEKW